MKSDRNSTTEKSVTWRYHALLRAQERGITRAHAIQVLTEGEIIEQRPRAESDIAVAAASVVAREGFINWLERKSNELGMRLERGVSPSVKDAARKLVETNGPSALREVAKVHFRTAHEIAPNDYPAPPTRENWRKAT